MAIVTLTELYGSLNGWPGNLLDAPPETVVNNQTATRFIFTYPPGHNFAGYKVTVAGSGFTYDSDGPTGGTISKIVISNPGGAMVVSVANIAPNTLASDFGLFYRNVFGFFYPGGDWGGSLPQNAWSMLLSGNDVINGTEGDDWQQNFLGMNAGNDVFNMKGGDDNIYGSMGHDTINGGDGWDTLWFNETNWDVGMSISQGIVVNVAAGTVIDAWGFTDQVSGIESYIGSVANDRFLGGANGDDFSGGRGVDTLNGGGGEDWVRYDNDTWTGGKRGIVVDLETSTGGGNIYGRIRDGFGNIDKTINIESVGGTRYNDVFVGSSADNTFAGGEGRDNYDGQGGSDLLRLDWDFVNGSTGSNVDLTRATGQILDDGFGNVENAISIENIRGSHAADRIKGSAGVNILEGNGGQDTLTGAGGADTFVWRGDWEFGQGDVISDFSAAAGANQDVLQFHMSDFGASTTLHLVNGTAATQAVGTFIFNTTNDVLYWDADGTGSAASVAVVTLTGVASLSAANFDLF